MTPYELWKWIPSTVKHFQIFGRRCYIKRNDENIGKFDSRYDESIHINILLQVVVLVVVIHCSFFARFTMQKIIVFIYLISVCGYFPWGVSFVWIYCIFSYNGIKNILNSTLFFLWRSCSSVITSNKDKLLLQSIDFMDIYTTHENFLVDWTTPLCLEHHL